MIKQVVDILTKKDLQSFTKEERRIIKLFCYKFAKGDYKKVLTELKEVIEMYEKEEENGRN